MPIHFSEITPQEAVSETGYRILQLSATNYLALKRGKDTVGVLALDGAEAGLFLSGEADRETLELVRSEASSRGAEISSVVTPLGVAAPDRFEQGRELLTWRRTPEDGPLPDPEEKLEPAPLSVVEKNFSRWHSTAPAWSKRQKAILRAPRIFRKSLHLDAIRQTGRITAYILYAVHGNEIVVLDAAVDPEIGVVKAGRPVFQALYLTYQEHNVIAPSFPVDDPMNRVFVAMRYHVVKRCQEWLAKPAGGDIEESA